MIDSPAITFLFLIAFFWGTAWGSFLNVVIYRLPEGLSLVNPGSRCSTCEVPIRWYDNIPCLSYLILRGRCRACGATFSPRYALIECACGIMSLVLFRAIFKTFEPDTIWINFAHWMWLQAFIYALVVIIFIDLEHFFIPDELSLPGTIIGIGGAYLLPMYSGQTALIGAAVGAGFMLAIFGLGWLIFKREALGLGDAKLMALIGAFLGWKPLAFVIFASSVQALLAVFLVRLYSKITGAEDTLTTTTEQLDAYFGEDEKYADQGHPSRTVIPYGPFLSLAALEALFFGDDFFWAFANQCAQLLYG
ncbi:MAG: prepilin peptidase [Myxococcales bacterium]|nr:prepilin peptidase [Myxococcales bacterium]